MPESVEVVAGTNATAAQYNVLRKDQVLGLKQLGTDTDGTTVTFDLSDKTKGNIRSVTLGGNRTLAISNGTVGQVFLLRIIQGAGGNTVTWFSTIKWPAGVTPTLSTGAGKIDVFGFIITSSGNYDGFICGQQL